MNSLAGTFSGICVLRNVYQGLLDSVQPAILCCFHFGHIGQISEWLYCGLYWAVRGLDRQEGLFGLILDIITQVLYVLSPSTHILLLC